MAHPLAIHAETFGTGIVPDATIEDLIHEHFDLRPGSIITDLTLRRPIYRPTAAYGHFGRPDLDLPWEHTPHADALRGSIMADRSATHRRLHLHHGLPGNEMSRRNRGDR